MLRRLAAQAVALAPSAVSQSASAAVARRLGGIGAEGLVPVSRWFSGKADDGASGSAPTPGAGTGEDWRKWVEQELAGTWRNWVRRISPGVIGDDV